MNQNRFFLLFVIVLLFSNLNAQHPGNRWATLFEDSEKVVYLDTTSIRMLDNQLSVWGLVVHVVPVKKENVDDDIYKTKTQFLINTLTNRYSVIGALYYDKKGRIIGESSSSRFTGSSQNSSSPVSDNALVGAFQEAAKNYLDKGSLSYNHDSYNLTEEYPDEKALLNEDEVKDYSRVIDTAKTDTDVNNENATEEFNTQPTIKEPEQTTTKTEVKSYYDNSSTDSRTNNYPQYNVDREKLVRNMVFTDGKVYCFQVAAWNEKSRAESEVDRLIQRGHKAFMTEVYLPQKGGTWYRVRVGYFNSYNEARQYQRNMQ